MAKKDKDIYFDLYLKLFGQIANPVNPFVHIF